MKNRRHKYSITALFLLLVMLVFLAACGGGNSANENADNSNNASEENAANGGEEVNNEEGEPASSDTGDLPRFITDPEGYYSFNDMIPFISTYEVIKHDASYRIEWLGEEEKDGEMLHKIYYLTDDVDQIDEYKETHVWIDDGGFDIAAESVSVDEEEIVSGVAHGNLVDALGEMLEFGFYYRDQIIDGDYDLVSIESHDDTLLDHDVEVFELEVYDEEIDETTKFTIAEGDNFEVILEMEIMGDDGFHNEYEIVELTFR